MYAHTCLLPLPVATHCRHIQQQAQTHTVWSLPAFRTAGLLTVQLAITAAVSAGFILSPPVKTYVWSNPWTFWTPFAASLALVVFLSCSESARRSHPTNLIILLLFTACEAVLVGTISAMYDTQVVLMAATMTVGITTCLTLYAMQTKRDFTAAGG